MARLLVLGALIALSSAGSAFAADATAIEMLGKDPGQAAAYSCFARHYDTAHLASHPKQNVRDIAVFVSSSIDSDSKQRRYDLEMGVSFRNLKQQFQVSGSCSPIDGQKGLTCGVDCDGGHFDVTTATGGQSLMVAVPDSVGIWDPAASDDDPNVLPKGAAFGADDKLFKLDRVDVEQCRPLMDDDAKAAIGGTAEAGK